MTETESEGKPPGDRGDGVSLQAQMGVVLLSQWFIMSSKRVLGFDTPVRAEAGVFHQCCWR